MTGVRPAGLLAMALAVTLAGCRPAAEVPGGAPDASTSTASGAPQLEEVRLVFPDQGGWLRLETRPMMLPAESQARAREVLAALLEGPHASGLIAPFPQGVELADVFVDPQGVAYVDFQSAELAHPPGSGSRLELLRVYSIADTVLLNVEGVRGVVLLWNGVQRPTLAGHVDLTRPLTLDLELLRSTP
jgi:germination protein M